MADLARDMTVELATVRNPSPVVHAGLALTVLVVATTLAVYKPLGLTPYGIQQQTRAMRPSRSEMQPSDTPGRYALLGTMGLIAAVIVWHLFGGGPHGH